MKLGTFGKGLALVATLSLVLAACSSKSDDTNPTAGVTGGGDAMSTAIITTNGSEPANPLIPSATNETGGGKIIDAMFAGLVYYDGEGAPHNIRVHTVAPGAVETQMMRSVLSHEQLPPEQALDPSDVAKVIGQCVSGDLKYTSGEVIYVHKTVG